MPDRVHFASDNNAGAHPAVLAALAAVNGGHVPAYGDDEDTLRAEDAIRALVDPAASVFFAFNGTGANVVALSAALRPYQGVICPAGAHINVDECAAFERFAGAKLIDVPVRDGKLTPADVVAQIHGVGDQHHVQPGAISVSQSTECGTVYGLDELRALGEIARAHGLFFHVDGARIANAVAALGCTLREMVYDTGVDAFTFGGTKNGLIFGEAIVFPRPHPAVAALMFVRKQAMQLASKMRFVGAQFEALLRDDLWLRNARHANAMAQLLADQLAGVEGIRLAYPVQANGVFPILPAHAIEPLQRKRRFYLWDAQTCTARWMTAWDTTADDVHDFAGAVRRIAGQAKALA
ncbi:MAG TPA: beta-eliminating lyase-related protein [Candidatus Baltobacteraceae bacterium]|nr:beta-eliminating lyase-related protein [Candidatus Baltobacteraceae bacterium]